MMGCNGLISLAIIASLLGFVVGHGEQPLSKISIHRATMAIHEKAYIKASPSLLGLKGQTSEWVSLEYSHPNPLNDDWIGVFSPAKFSTSLCEKESGREEPPLLCTSPIKFQNANYTNPDYSNSGKGFLKLQLINQREDFSFALFSGGLSNPKMIAVSNTVTFSNPKAPVYPRLAQGKSWNEVGVL